MRFSILCSVWAIFIRNDIRCLAEIPINHFWKAESHSLHSDTVYMHGKLTNRIGETNERWLTFVPKNTIRNWKSYGFNLSIFTFDGKRAQRWHSSHLSLITPFNGANIFICGAENRNIYFILFLGSTFHIISLNMAYLKNLLKDVRILKQWGAVTK